jgi:hypothetical protein
MAGKKAYNRKKWNILFIGEDGRVVTVKHFKGMVAGLALSLTLLSAAVAVLYYQHQNRTEQVGALKNAMAQVAEENRDLKDEKDQMLARLVILESALKAYEEPVGPQDVDRPRDSGASPQDTGGEPSPIRADVNKEQKIMPGEPAADALEGSGDEAPPISITNTNLVVCQDPNSDNMRVEYKVMNIGPKDTPVEGRSVIVLKGGNMNPEDWIVLPNVPLLDLKPAGDRGKRFRIYNFRTLKYTITSPADINLLENATIFTYTEDGRLLMERDYPLEMSAEMCP